MSSINDGRNHAGDPERRERPLNVHPDANGNRAERRRHAKLAKHLREGHQLRIQPGQKRVNRAAHVPMPPQIDIEDVTR